MLAIMSGASRSSRSSDAKAGLDYWKKLGSNDLVQKLQSFKDKTATQRDLLKVLPQLLMADSSSPVFNIKY